LHERDGTSGEYRGTGVVLVASMVFTGSSRRLTLAASADEYP